MVDFFFAIPVNKLGVVYSFLVQHLPQGLCMVLLQRENISVPKN